MIANNQSYRSQLKATLNIRNGYVYFIEPKPSLQQANSISNDIKASFDGWQDSYKESVADAAKIQVDKLHFSMTPEARVSPSGNTRTIDYPLLIYNDSNKSFSTRMCFAICTGNTNTKMWSRASLPTGPDGIVSPTKLNQIQSLCKIYRGITSSSIEWLKKELPKVFEKYLENFTIRDTKVIKVSILGVDDDIIAKPFADFNSQETTAAKILKDKVLDEILTSYFRIISDIEPMLSDYANRKNPNIEPSIFFKIPVWISSAKGYIEPRSVLFLLRERQKFTEITGLAYDDSLDMDVPLRAGAKLSKIIGFWI